MTHPYRTPSPRPEPPPDEPADDLAQPFTLAAIWLSSVLRYALAVGHQEPFGFQPALALAITVLAPLLVARAWWRGRR